MTTKTRTIKVDYLARVEGEGALLLKMDGEVVTDVQLRIFEPPRFFEALLRGRAYSEAPDITARICGICPVAYQMSAVHALEGALGVRPPRAIRDLRRLLYCGEWIESHALHIHMLHAPDFLGYPDGVTMAKDHGPAVQRGLQLKKVGNAVLRLLGGREIHPINVRVGGFYKLPTKAELLGLSEQLRWARDAALETTRWVATFPFPDLEYDYNFVALRHDDEYPLNEGRIVSSKGLDIDAAEYETHFEEVHVEHSNALWSRLRDGGTYLVGPMARYALNADRLSPLAREAAVEARLGSVCRNPFKSVIVRAVEMAWACDEALRLIDSYEPCPEPFTACEPQVASGFAATEAPRGLLYHRYRLAADGSILEAKIVPPTSQNQRMIEDDLRRFAPRLLHLDQQQLTLRCEQAIRNYDPCISCATHFLTVTIERA